MIVGHLVMAEHEETQKLLEAIKSLDPWFYPVVIGGILVAPGLGSTVSTMRQSQRTLYREHLIVEEALHRIDVTGARVLDLACNMGYWSYRYAVHGAASVMGVEGRKQFIDQARLFWAHCDALPAKRVKIINGNVLDNTTWLMLGQSAPFDVCLCCGLLYHLPDYRDFLDLVVEVTKVKALVIDTRVTAGREKPRKEPSGIHFNSLDDAPKIAVTPNCGRLVTHLRSLGYEVEVLRPRFFMPESTKAVDNYVNGNRVTIVCWKK